LKIIICRLVANHPKLRIRRKGDRFEITKKTPIDGDVSRQLEQTIPISEAEFMELTSGLKRKVAKNRYTVENEGRTAEIDIFIGEHEGLILCDFEFETDEELHNFKTPDFVLADVTTEDIIAGGILSGTTRDELFEILSEKYGL
jgi:CYTH domain-containing protein